MCCYQEWFSHSARSSQKGTPVTPSYRTTYQLLPSPAQFIVLNNTVKFKERLQVLDTLYNAILCENTAFQPGIFRGTWLRGSLDTHAER